MEGGKEGPGEEERTERRDETGLFHLEKGCVWRQRRRRQVDRKEAKKRERMGRKRPLCYPELSVSVCMSVLTQSKSICHQDCHCGTKREGSLPGRTHSERNGERQDRHKEAWWSLGEVQVGLGKIYTVPPTATTPNTPAVIRKIRLPIPSSTLFSSRYVCWLYIIIHITGFW